MVLPMLGNSIPTTDGTGEAVRWVSEEAYGNHWMMSYTSARPHRRCKCFSARCQRKQNCWYHPLPPKNHLKTNWEWTGLLLNIVWLWVWYFDSDPLKCYYLISLTEGGLFVTYQQTTSWKLGSVQTAQVFASNKTVLLWFKPFFYTTAACWHP